MAVTINLLKNRHTLSEAEYQRERNFYRYAMLSLVMVMVVTVAISIWQLVLSRELASLESSIGASTKELAGLSSANAKQIYLKSRLKLITAFLDDRSVARQALQRIFSINIPGVSVSGASFESESVLSVQATANDVLSLSQLIDYLTNDNDFFLQIVSRGITRLPDGKYQMDVSLTIPKG